MPGGVVGTTAHPIAFSHKQLEELWINAGGKRSLANTMAAIAEAESGGRPNEISSIEDPFAKGSHARGLWQVEYPLHSSLIPSGGLNPLENAKAAVKIYDSEGLRAWQTYTEGTYRQFLGGTKSAPGIIGTVPGQYKGTTTTEAQLGIASTVAESPEKVYEALKEGFEWGEELGKFLHFLTTKEGWDRILKIVGGGILVFVAARELFPGPTQEVEQGVKKTVGVVGTGGASLAARRYEGRQRRERGARELAEYNKKESKTTSSKERVTTTSTKPRIKAKATSKTKVKV